MASSDSPQTQPDLQPTSRRYEFTVRVAPDVLRRAATFFMWRRLRLRYVLGWVGAGLGTAVYRATHVGLLTDAIGLLTALLVLVLVLLPIAIWLAIGRTVKGYAKLTGGAPVHYEVDGEWLKSRYQNGAGELRWNAFEKVLRTNEVALLSMAAEQRFIPLPIGQVPEDALLFIEAEVAAHGGE